MADCETDQCPPAPVYHAPAEVHISTAATTTTTTATNTLDPTTFIAPRSGPAPSVVIEFSRLIYSMLAVPMATSGHMDPDRTLFDLSSPRTILHHPRSPQLDRNGWSFPRLVAPRRLGRPQTSMGP
ncbi:hypothetical protein AG1IA_04226 [Rhizoctonia solani AG-1 IA]|uniref:Uncharacterized protein n=1 Tax=Thanatephorus cucumeris (strain AG1-IA) TaxID=983506 RepID=L8WZH0_THACA|nr:hypothetical protein AG1IA_04226 [Rhizoctonia solani AG-1 IA]